MLPVRSWRSALLIFVTTVAIAGCGGDAMVSRDAATERALARIEHVVVIYGENRSFDNLYGLFPGANGIADATPAQIRQRDRDGSLFAMLPPTWKSDGKTPDPAYGGSFANAPFRIDQAPINLPLATATRDLVHRFYQNREQINGGKLDQYAAWSDAGGFVMGYYDGSSLPLWALAKQYTLADNFFMGAFGGSFLNHFWLICACTPTFPNAPASLVSVLDANGKLALKPTSPASAMNGAPQFVNDGALTPDFYAVNTMQPAYQPSGIPPAPGGDPALADPAKNPLPTQTATTIGDTLSAKGIEWAWYAGAWNAAVADGMQAPAVKRTVIYDRAAGAANFQPHHQPFNYFSRYAPGTAGAQSTAQGLHGSRRRHRHRKAPGRRVLQAAGQFQRAPGLHRRALGRSAHRGSCREDQVEPDLELHADRHHLRRERRILGSRRAARRRSMGPGNARPDDRDRPDGQEGVRRPDGLRHDVDPQIHHAPFQARAVAGCAREHGRPHQRDRDERRELKRCERPSRPSAGIARPRRAPRLEVAQVLFPREAHVGRRLTQPV